MTLPDSIRWLPVLSIEPAGTEECVCISVSHPTRCYVGESGIISHNSDTSGPIDRLPPNPRKFIDAMLSGAPLDEAARSAGLDAERAPSIARNIGRYLHHEWTQQGLSPEDAQRQLAQRASDLALGAGPRRKLRDLPVEGLEGAFRGSGAAARATGAATPLEAVSNNHLDRFVSGKVGDALNAIRSTQPVQQAADFLGHLYHDTIPGQLLERAVHFVQKQAAPLSVMPREAVALMKEMQIRQAFGRERALDVQRSLSGKAKFSDLGYPAQYANDGAMKKRLWLAMKGEAPMASLPPEMQQVAAKLRRLLDDVGQQAVSEGRMSADTYLGMKDTYLPHYYADGPDAPGLAGMWKRFRLGMQDIRAQRLTAWRIEDTESKDKDGAPRLITWDPGGKKWRFKSAEHRDAFYSDFIKDQALKDLRNRQGKFKGLDRDALDNPETIDPETRGHVNEVLRNLRQRYTRERPLSQEEHEQLGLIQDPIYAVARHVAQMEHDTATAHFFNEVLKRPDWVSDSAALGYKQIPDNSAFGRLAGRYVKDELHEQITDMAQTPEFASRLYDGALAMWKSGHTVWNPGRAVRDILGNFQFSQLAGNNILNPANHEHYARALAAFRKGGPDLELLYKHGIAGAGFNNSELKAALQGLLPDAATIQHDPSTLLRLWNNLSRKWTKTSTLAHHLYETKDEIFKAASFFHQLQRGQSPEDAALHVRKWFPFYDNQGTSWTIRGVKRFVHPFFTFYKESARILTNAVKERPLALGASLLAPYAISRLSAAVLGLTDDDLNEITKDMRGKGKFLGQDSPLFSVLLPMHGASGQTQQWDISTTMPFSDLLGRKMEDNKPSPWWEYMAKALVSGSPLISTPVGIAQNADTFGNRQIWDADMTSSEKAHAAASYVWRQIAPPYAPGGSLATMAVSALRGERSTNKTLEKRDLGQAMARLAGIDIRNANPNTFRMADEYRARHNIPKSTGPEMMGSTAAQRAKDQLFAELARDNPDTAKIARVLTLLRNEGHPIDSLDDIHALLAKHNPLTVIQGAQNQTQFRSELHGVDRQVLEQQLTEYQHIASRAPQVLSEAKRLMPPPGLHTPPPAKKRH